MARAAAAKENGARPGLPRSTDDAPTATRISLFRAKHQRASRVPGANSLEMVMPCWTHSRQPPIAPGYTALLLPHLDRLFVHRRALLLGQLLEGVVGRAGFSALSGSPCANTSRRKAVQATHGSIPVACGVALILSKRIVESWNPGVDLRLTLVLLGRRRRLLRHLFGSPLFAPESGR